VTIRWGIIGCGQVCELKSGPALYKNAASEVSIVMRRDLARAQDYARRHGVRRFTDDASRVIEAPDVDAVYVATPPGTHMEYALNVAAAGKPCYVEKPMARSATECRRMCAAFQAAGQPLFVAYYRRALPRFLKLKALIDSGKLGRVASVSHCLKRPAAALREGAPLPWRLDAAQSGGGLFLDLASHAFDLFDFLLGPIRQVAGHAANHARRVLVEDTVVAVFSFESGVVGTASYQFVAGVYEDRLEVVGDRGQVTCSMFGTEPLELCDDDGSESIVVEHPVHVQAPLIASIVDELNGKTARCPSRDESALRTSIVIDKVLHAYYGGRDDSFWERPATWPGLAAPSGAAASPALTPADRS
jgi:1,5-anhydro-D-fructose reductase (1,5-anhydro-D-mannitol-forming)